MTIHIAGFPLRIGNRVRQLCAWCGERLIDDDLDAMAFAPGSDSTVRTFEVNALVSVERTAGLVSTGVFAHPEGEPLPVGSCARERRLELVR